jgi:hypothetical protein
VWEKRSDRNDVEQWIEEVDGIMGGNEKVTIALGP